MFLGGASIGFDGDDGDDGDGDVDGQPGGRQG
jgi:hypothetical protein